MGAPVESFGFTAEILFDPDPVSPREWDCLGRIVTWHGRYSIGDEQPRETPREWLESFAVECGCDVEGRDSSEGLIASIRAAGGAVLPIYLYDHGGLVLSVGPFSCPWDSGQVGWIVATPAKIKAEGITREQAEIGLRAEVATLSKFLEGDVYGYRIFSHEGDEVDSCWGIFGIEEAREQAKESIIGLLGGVAASS